LQFVLERNSNGGGGGGGGDNNIIIIKINVRKISMNSTH
jgi:hypothetical protein